jgi:hypothetical protein
MRHLKLFPGYVPYLRLRGETVKSARETASAEIPQQIHQLSVPFRSDIIRKLSFVSFGQAFDFDQRLLAILG